MSTGVLLALLVTTARAEEPAPVPATPPAAPEAPPATPEAAPATPAAAPGTPAAAPATPEAPPAPETPPASGAAAAAAAAPVVVAPPPLPAEAPPAAPTAPAEDEEDLWRMLENMPPRRSWDLSVGVNYTDVTFWRAYTAPWVGLGIRVAYGPHLGESRLDRLGGSVSFSTEGPVPEFYTLALEPSLDWDRVNKGLQIGASIGPAVFLHNRLTLTGPETHFGASPWAGVRVGWSQPWSRVMRRMFVVANPKIRVISGLPSWSVGVAVGSGTGR